MNITPDYILDGLNECGRYYLAQEGARLVEREATE